MPRQNGTCCADDRRPWHAIGRIALFVIVVTKATGEEPTVYTGPTELVTRAIGESLQADPILGLPEWIGHIDFENKRAEWVGSFRYGPIG